jgi:P-type Ca2+ transporter type 2C
VQFQLTVNVVALAVTFVSAVLQREPPLNPVMMLWVNLIMDTMGALALGTEPPSRRLLQRRPYSSNTSLVSRRMWRHIAVQSIFQFTMLITLLLIGESALGINTGFIESIGVLSHKFYSSAGARNRRAL